MARLTIEDQWWTDPRRERLAELVGSLLLADAHAIRLWRLAQEHWGRGRKPVPVQIFEALEAAPKLIQAGLAEADDDGVYVKGSRDYTDWLHKKRQAAASGGKKSATRPRDASGKLKKSPKQTPSTIQADAKIVQPSGSGSDSGSEIQKNPSGSSAVALVPASGPPGKINPVWLWCDIYKRFFGHSPELLKEDAGKLTNFAKGRSEEKLRVLFSCYFQIAKQFYIDRGYPVSVFFADLQAINKAAETGVDPSKPKPFDISRLKD